VLFCRIFVMLSPSDIPRKRLTGWPSCHQRDLVATVELVNDPLEFGWVAQVTFVGASSEVMAMGCDGVRPDVCPQDHLESGPMQAETEPTGTAEQINGKGLFLLQAFDMFPKVLQLTGIWMGFQLLLRPLEGL
jgi:hypothetical protein